MSRTRRQPAQAPAVVPCRGVSWLPAGARIIVEDQHGALKLGVRVGDDEVGIVAALVEHVHWPAVWLQLCCLAWSRHRLALLQAQAEAKEQASYAKAEQVAILRKDGER